MIDGGWLAKREETGQGASGGPQGKRNKGKALDDTL